jgi:hypothetical protein
MRAAAAAGISSTARATNVGEKGEQMPNTFTTSDGTSLYYFIQER